MKVQPILSSSQLAIVQSGDVIAQAKIAKSTEDVSVQKELADSKNGRILVALASNPNLSSDVETTLVKMINQFPAIGRTLAERNARAESSDD